MVTFLYRYWNQYCPLTQSHWSWLQTHARSQRVPRGEILYQPGDRADDLYFVANGLLATVWWDREGSRKIERFLLPTHVALTKQNLYTKTAFGGEIRSLQRSQLVRLPLKALRDGKDCVPEIQTLVNVMISRKTKQHQLKHRLLLIHNEVERYLAFLRNEELRAFRACTSQQEHADYLCISRSSVTRAMRKF